MPQAPPPTTLFLGFCGIIDSSSVGRIAAAFNQAVNDGLGAVHLTFSSPGGDASAGVYLYHHIRSLQLHTTIHNMGMVASVATTIYAAANYRTAEQGSIFMIHPVHASANGAHATMMSTMDMILAEESRIDAILRERAFIPEHILANRRHVDVFFTAQQALDYSLVHDISSFTLPPGNQIFHL